MSEIRRITITGGASVLTGTAPITGDTARTTRRQRVKQVQPIMRVVVEEKVPAPVQNGGGDGADAPTTKTIQVIQTVEPATTPVTQPSTTVPLSNKVILSGKKPRQMKVLLTKKNHEGAPPSAPVNAAPTQQKNRKVTLGLQHLKRRVTKARRLQKISKTVSIDQIRKELLAAKIIKEDSKAPEAILRQMYSDAKIVSTKSL